jgi:hypothetical protein
MRPAKDNGKRTQLIPRRRKISPEAKCQPSSSPHKVVLRKVVLKTQEDVNSAINHTSTGIRRNLDHGVMKSTLAQETMKHSFVENALRKRISKHLEPITNYYMIYTCNHSSMFYQ